MKGSAVLIGLMLFIGIACMVTDVMALEAGEAKGSMSWKGKQFSLDYAYAKIIEREGSSTTDLHVLLTNKPLSTESLKDEDKIEDLISVGELVTLELVYCCNGNFKEMNQIYVSHGYADTGDDLTIAPLRMNGSQFEGSGSWKQTDLTMKTSSGALHSWC